MKQLILLTVLMLSFGSQAFDRSPFQELGEKFEKATHISFDTHIGYQAGRCYDHESQETPDNSLLVLVKRQQDRKFNMLKMVGLPADHFDKMSHSEIDALILPRVNDLLFTAWEDEPIYSGVIKGEDYIIEVRQGEQYLLGAIRSGSNQRLGNYDARVNEILVVCYYFKPL